MKLTIVSIIVAILIGFVSLGFVQSKATETQQSVAPHIEAAAAVSAPISEKDLKVQLTKSLSAVFSRDAVITNAKATPIDGVYEVLFNEGTIVYTTLDGSYFFYGSNLGLFQNNNGEVANLTAKTLEIAEQSKSKDRLPLLNQMSRDDLVIFSPKGEVKASVIVFTDVDCGYCRKLHSEIESYLDLGIEIKYAAFPRAGLSGNSFDKIVTAWCAPNQQQTMTMLKSNQSVKMQTCDNPVAQQYQLGRQVGVTGTPSIFTEDGQIIPGYRPAADLAKVLGI
ncbi:DsbC family protein [Marinicellulosiphila megalodicopiae]|uniref:DsbC family protein n=1 Tax=Marinicellulosiphila megalodicopiae TaxID=2724896 RepID=UPI003BB0CFAB